MNATGIEYLDFTWSPLVGCSGIGCAVYNNCWAKYMKKRNLNGCPDCTAFKPHRHFERLEQPFHTKKPSIIGVCFSADFWDKGFSWIDRSRVMNVTDHAKQHWFINLTKQTQNIPTLTSEAVVFSNNWIQGASICTEADLYRVKDLVNLKELGYLQNAVLSIEPLYQRLPNLTLEGIDWVIIGAQTHPLKLPEREWVYEIIDKARALKIPVFIKNNIPYGEDYKMYPSKMVEAHEVVESTVTSCNTKSNIVDSPK